MHAVGRATHLAATRGDVERAGTLSNDWFTLAREVGDEAAAADATFHRAGYRWTQGNLDEAVRLYQDGLTFWRTRGDTVQIGGHPFSGAVMVGGHLYNLGWLLLQRGDLEQARGCLVEVVSLAGSIGDAVQEGMGLAGLGLLAYTTETNLHEAGQLVKRALKVVAELGHTSLMGLFLDLLAHIAAAQGQVARAGLLFGVAEAVRDAVQSRERYHELVLGAEHERQVAAMRSGPEATRFSAAWAQGRSLSLEEAVADALAEEEPAAAAVPRSSALRHAAGGLSPREREVVVLVARGLSNREIATQLVITERTAGAHVEHILDKLGFASRTQIGVWAAEHGLVASGPS